MTSIPVARPNGPGTCSQCPVSHRDGARCAPETANARISCENDHPNGPSTAGGLRRSLSGPSGTTKCLQGITLGIVVTEGRRDGAGDRTHSGPIGFGPVGPAGGEDAGARPGGVAAWMGGERVPAATGPPSTPSRPARPSAPGPGRGRSAAARGATARHTCSLSPSAPWPGRWRSPHHRDAPKYRRLAAIKTAYDPATCSVSTPTSRPADRPWRHR